MAEKAKPNENLDAEERQDAQLQVATADAFSEGNWYHEKLEDGYTISYQIKEVFHRAKSAFQAVEVVDTVPFGRALITDRLMQSASRDEFIYHESLVQPALCAHPNPKRVYIGGGGEGATLREVHTATNKLHSILRVAAVTIVVVISNDNPP